jgi:hypothetical protein
MRDSLPQSRSGREWIPVREAMPAVNGKYETLIKPILGEPFEKVQRYEKQAHPAFSGWRYMPVTHWRAPTESTAKP